MAATLATIVIKGIFDTTGIFVGAKKAEKGLTGIAKGLGDKLGITTALANPTTAAVAAIGAAAAYSGYQLHEAFKRVDDIDKMAQRFDIAAESVQRLGAAAKLGETDFDTLMSGVQKMSMTIGTGGMPLDKRLAQVAEQIAAIEDPGQRAAKSMEIFGKAGLQMQNLLMGGSKQIENATKLIDDFGIGLTELDVSNITRANDAWDKMSIVLDGLWQKVAAQFAPLVADALEFTLDALKDIGVVLASQGITWDRVGNAARMAMSGAITLGRGLLTTMDGIAISVLKLEAGFYSAASAAALLQGNIGRSAWFGDKAKETLEAAGKLEQSLANIGNKMLGLGPAAGGKRRGGLGEFGIGAVGSLAGLDKGSVDEIRTMLAISKQGSAASPEKETAKNTKETVDAIKTLIRQWNATTGFVLATPEF